MTADMMKVDAPLNINTLAGWSLFKWGKDGSVYPTLSHTPIPLTFHGEVAACNVPAGQKIALVPAVPSLTIARCRH